MTEPSHDRDDELRFDDDDLFVLDEAEGGDANARTPGRTGAPAGTPRGDTSAEEDGVLFEPTQGSGTGFANEGPPFNEKGKSSWAGGAMSAEDIGIETGGEERPGAAPEPGPDDVHEIELSEGDFAVEDEDGAAETGAPGESLESDEPAADQEISAEGEELRLREDTGAAEEPVAASAGEESAEDAQAGESVEFADGGEAAPADDWAPLPEAGLEDEAEGESAPADEAVDESVAEEPEPTFDEVVEAEPQLETVGAVPEAGRVHRFRRFVAAAAALVVLGGGAGVYFLAPEMVGLGETPEVSQRAELKRPEPKVDWSPKPPSNQGTGETARQPDQGEPGPGQGTDTTPPDQRPNPATVATGQALARMVRGLGQLRLAGRRAGAGRTQVRQPDPSPTPTTDTPGVVVLTPEQAGEPLPLSDDVAMSGRERVTMERQAPIVSGLMAGSQAFAQMRNNAFFLGTVKRIDDASITLRLEKGEVTLAMGDLSRLVPLGTAEFNELRSASKGFVRLTNRNRIVGSILGSVQDDHVIVDIQSNRVLIPRHEIEEIGNVGQANLAFPEEDDGWLQKLVERRMLERSEEKSKKGGDKDAPKSKLKMPAEEAARPDGR
ncbi:MAG: hypothetical protein IT458_07165 [Planctomycetes bacterium]|nr:hypothetical protein [Planctomycetota bacterium]